MSTEENENWVHALLHWPIGFVGNRNFLITRRRSHMKLLYIKIKKNKTPNTDIILFLYITYVTM
jgi:superfamily I DNA and/or RNA helicase